MVKKLASKIAKSKGKKIAKAAGAAGAMNKVRKAGAGAGRAMKQTGMGGGKRAPIRAKQSTKNMMEDYGARIRDDGSRPKTMPRGPRRKARFAGRYQSDGGPR